jgi:hypothetical protein
MAEAEIFRRPVVGRGGFLQVDTVARADRGAEMAGDAAFFSVRVPREDDAAAIAGGEFGFLFRILDGFRAVEQMQEGQPATTQGGEDEHGLRVFFFVNKKEAKKTLIL